MAEVEVGGYVCGKQDARIYRPDRDGMFPLISVAVADDICEFEELAAGGYIVIVSAAKGRCFFQSDDQIRSIQWAKHNVDGIDWHKKVGIMSCSSDASQVTATNKQIVTELNIGAAVLINPLPSYA